MEAQGRGHVEDLDPQRPASHSGEEEQHHEKQSVMMKVKNKARKFKDTLTKKHAHDGEGEGEQHVDRRSEEESDDDERDEDPELHGAPMYDSEEVRKLVEDDPGTELSGLGAIGAVKEDPGAPRPQSTTGEFIPGSYQSPVTSDAPSSAGRVEPGVIRSFHAMSVSDRQEKGTEKSNPPSVEGPAQVPKEEESGHAAPKPQSTTGELITGSYQSPVTSDAPSSAGRVEPGVIRSDQPEKGTEKSNPPPLVEGPARVPKEEEMGPGAPRPQSTTGEMIPVSPVTSDPPSSAGRVEPGVIRSFQAMSISDEPEEDREESKPPSVEGPAQVPKEAEMKEQEVRKEQSYTEMISAAATVVKDAVMTAATTATGSLSATGANTSERESTADSEGPTRKDKGVSMREYLAEKLSPGEEDKTLSEVLSEAIKERKGEARDVRETSTEGEESKAMGSEEKPKTPKGVVGRIKGAVSSLFAGGGGSGGTSAAPAREEVTAEEQETRRLQGSGN